MSPEPRSLWCLIDAIAVAMARGYGLARSRALLHAAPMTRMLAQRDHLYSEAALLERELAVFRAYRLAKSPRRRAQFAPEQRSEILQLAGLRGWTAVQTAKRFGLHPNTIRNWKRALRRKRRADRLVGEPPWNRLHQMVRWTVHEIRRLCPEREFGTRTIARHMIRGGIQISRTSVRRILEEEHAKPGRSGGVVSVAAGEPTQDTEQLLNPRKPHAVWHVDLTEIRVLWRRFEVAAIIDGYSRKAMAVRCFNGRPTTADVLKLIGDVVDHEGVAPRFLISDHGSQFQSAFKERCKALGVKHVRGRVGAWQLNAKVERFFRTMKTWQRRAWMVPSLGEVQSRLDAFRSWYNSHRPHAAHGRTPAEQVGRAELIGSVNFYAKGEREPEIETTCHKLEGDPLLPVLIIRVREGPVAA